MDNIIAKVQLGIKLSEKERAKYLLLGATEQGIDEYLANEKK